MLQAAFESKREERAYQLYVSVRQNMTEETYQEFHEFYQTKKEVAEPENKQSAEEILLNVKEMMSSHSWR